jgi:hypothetical protein
MGNKRMRNKAKARKGKYRGELRSRFNIIEQWDGKKWREPPEVGDYGDGIAPDLHFGPDDDMARRRPWHAGSR